MYGVITLANNFSDLLLDFTVGRAGKQLNIKVQNRTIYIKLTSIYDPYGEVYE